MTKVAILLALSGCWHFSEPEEPTPSNRVAPSAPRRRSAPRADAPRDTASSGSPAQPTPASGPALSTGSPARPATPTGAPRRAPPPCVNGRVISAVLSPQREARLVVNVGADRGVSPSWKAMLMDPAQTPARLVEVQQAISRVAISGLTPDQLRDNPIVALCP